jgi:hypothetical protein
MPVYKRTKMCSECPFRQQSTRGWLGPWTPEQLEAIRRMDEVFICHREVAKLKGRPNLEGDNCEITDTDGLSDEAINARGQHCVGMLRYMNGMCQLSRDEEKRAAQRRLKEVADQPVLKVNTFIEHHTLRK